MFKEIIIAAALSMTGPSADSENAKVEQAARLLRDGKAVDALVVLDAVIGAFETRYADEKRQIFCAHGSTETLFYMASAAKDHQSAIAIQPSWCDALFMKGYALVQLGRLIDGRAPLEKAVAMAPSYAHYQNELAYNYQSTSEWPRSLELYERAYGSAEIGDPSMRTLEQGRALRGQGYVLVEQGKWDEAKVAYEKALKLDPNDGKAKGELGYIAEHRPR